ncbi:MAG TPA: SPOR domain-containing protein [Ramlibacter sp.]|nr:SPOR domain-containing protein [Ramlibacter sp.]
MAFFQSRKGGDETAAAARQPESIEAMRRRAKHRLIGASVLVLVGVVGFPLLFDSQPRPISVDIPIEIPDRNKVKPLPAPAPAAVTPAVTQAPPPVASSPVVSAPAPAPAPTLAASVAKAGPAPAPAPAEAKPESRADDGAKALALLEGKPVANTPVDGEGRFVVQVGAFADAVKARETRLKVEHAGLKTYTQVVETKEGKRIRVRVGPFASKADADRAAEKVKGLDLQASVLTL